MRYIPIHSGNTCTLFKAHFPLGSEMKRADEQFSVVEPDVDEDVLARLREMARETLRRDSDE